MGAINILIPVYFYWRILRTQGLLLADKGFQPGENEQQYTAVKWVWNNLKLILLLQITIWARLRIEVFQKNLENPLLSF